MQNRRNELEDLTKSKEDQEDHERDGQEKEDQRMELRRGIEKMWMLYGVGG